MNKLVNNWILICHKRILTQKFNKWHVFLLLLEIIKFLDLSTVMKVSLSSQVFYLYDSLD